MFGSNGFSSNDFIELIVDELLQYVNALRVFDQDVKVGSY